ncbi:MAG: class I SAM-dependent methyltransferase [Bryobacterales bacterium]|nr:class I SAM-dependent methyltransferase [Bryobacterales bacterium]
MLKSAGLKQGEMLYDLGSGDGRVVITAASKFGANAVGVELNESLVKLATARIAELGLAQKASIIHGNALDTDLSEADVVTLFLLTKSNEMLRPNLEKYLKPQARVVPIRSRSGAGSRSRWRLSAWMPRRTGSMSTWRAIRRRRSLPQNPADPRCN